MSAGILNEEQVIELISPKEGNKIRLTNSSTQPLNTDLVGGSAIDIPLGNEYWEMKGSCRTGSEYNVTDLLDKYAVDKNSKSLDDSPVILQRRKVYLFKADCRLDLSDQTIQGKATGKSSVGRLDVLVRLLVDESDRFDIVKKGRKHELYVEVTPISFDLLVRRGTALSQLRLYKGKEEDISLTRGELIEEDDTSFPVLDENRQLLKGPCEKEQNDIWFPFRLDLTPDKATNCSAFAVKKGVCFDPIDPDLEGVYDPHEYWEPIEWENGAILLEPDRLYIMRSKERLRIPGHLALECKSYTTEMGEWRIEYAGFAHPYFGSMRKDSRGSPIMFEVRGHNVPTILTDGIPLGNARFLRMSRAATEPKKMGTYEEQELKLSKCFSSW